MNALRTVVEQIAIVNSRLLEMTARSDTAAMKKDSLLEDYKQHVRTHGC